MRFLVIPMFLLAAGMAQAGSPRLAAEIKREYETATSLWAQRIETASDPEAQMEVMRQRPDPAEYAGRMWGELQSSLSEDWTLDYAAWLIESAPAFAAQPIGAGTEKQSPLDRVRHAVDRFHVASPKVGRICLSLTALPDPKTLALVEKIEKGNPDEAVQGQAAMAIAMLLSGLGEGRDIMVRRLNCLEQAIIKAEDVKVGDVTVGKLAEDELYVIRHLAKGRTAPDIIGRDVTGVPFKLSLLPSKVTVLAFWHSSMRDSERALELLRKLHQQHGHRGMQLIGVTTDPKPVLRMLTADGTVPWRNFADSNGRITNQYRVRSLPLVYVLDQKMTIQYIGGPGSFVDLTVEALLAE